jgi:hypothetical protein
MTTAKKRDVYSKARCRQEVRKACRLLALLYHHFATTLVEELGQAEGERLIDKAVWSFGKHRGEEIRRQIEAQSLELTQENVNKLSDLPPLGWETKRIDMPNGEKRTLISFCPLAETWKELGAESLGRRYCFVDQAKHAASGLPGEFVHAQNVLDGDTICEMFIETQSPA